MWVAWYYRLQYHPHLHTKNKMEKIIEKIKKMFTRKPQQVIVLCGPFSTAQTDEYMCADKCGRKIHMLREAVMILPKGTIKVCPWCAYENHRKVLPKHIRKNLKEFIETGVLCR